MFIVCREHINNFFYRYRQRKAEEKGKEDIDMADGKEGRKEQKKK
jgi:hypothetical protein